MQAEMRSEKRRFPEKKVVWIFSIDAFASEANSLLPRFLARYAEQVEAENAFEVSDWDRSLCPAWGRMHRETLFAFQQSALLNHFVTKARADGIRAVVVTPLEVSAPYWSKLLRSLMFNNEKGYLRVLPSPTAAGCAT